MSQAHATDLWIFGYGSLMWRPGFEFIEMHRAKLSGWHRRFCIVSRYHRGSHHRPGLVLGLDRGGQTEGIVYRVPALQAAAVLKNVRARELISGVYREALLPVTLAGGEGRTVPALVYLAEKAHPSFNDRFPVGMQAHIIAGARGRSGSNVDYLAGTVAELGRLSIRERELERIVTCLGAIRTRRPGPTCWRLGTPSNIPGWPRRRRIRVGELTRFLYRTQIR